MNITMRAFPSSKSERRTMRPVVTSGRAKSGASVPRASMVEVPANSTPSFLIDSIVTTRAVEAAAPRPAPFQSRGLPEKLALDGPVAELRVDDLQIEGSGITLDVPDHLGSTV